MATTVDDISEMAKALVDAEELVNSAEYVLKQAKERFRYLQEETIPAAMQELGLESLTLTTGEKLKVKQEVYASLTAANKPAAFQWLEEHDFGGLIKVEVSVQYGKGELEDAVELKEKLSQQGINAEMSQDVNAQTLKAFLREQIAKGAPIPLELFGARPVWQAKISKK